jgi:hypothetical protein
MKKPLLDCDYVVKYPVPRVLETLEEHKALLVAYNISDGTIAARKPNKAGYANHLAQFYGTHETLTEVVKSVKAVFGITPSIRLKSSANPKHVCHVVELPNAPAKDLLRWGAFVGKKVETTMCVPDWVMNGSENVKRVFLSSLWGAEGSTPSTSKHDKNPRSQTMSIYVKPDFYTPTFFNQLKKLGDDLGVNFTVKVSEVKGRTVQKLYVKSNLDNYIKFFEEVGYYPEKQKEIRAFKLVQYLKTYRNVAQNKLETYKRAISEKGVTEAAKSFGLSKGGLRSVVYNGRETKAPKPPRSFPTYTQWLQEREVGDGLKIHIVEKKVSEDFVQMYNISVASTDRSYLLANGVNNFNSFTVLSNRVYSNFEFDKNLLTGETDLTEYADIHVGIDFNVSQMSAVIAVKVADEIHVIDELILTESNTQELADVLKVKYQGKHIYCYPDPSGRSRKSSAALGQTDFTILEDAGFYVSAPKRHDAVQDRINTVQSLLCNANGERRLYVHKRCKSLLDSLQGLTYDVDKNAPDKKSGLDHCSDSLGYLCLRIAPINQRVTTFKLAGLL